MKMQMGYTHTLTITSRPADDQSLKANAVQGLQCPLLATPVGGNNITCCKRVHSAQRD